MIIKANAKMISCIEGESLMTVLLCDNQNVVNICNGKGTCGKCKVKILSALPEPTHVEYEKLSPAELSDGIRLACQTKPYDGMEVALSLAGNVDRKGMLLLNQEETHTKSGVQLVPITVDLPSLEDERGDWDRLLHKMQETCSLSQVNIDLRQLKGLASIIRQAKCSVTAVLWNNQVLSIRPGEWTGPVYGVAIDIGTTNIAVALYNLETGRLIEVTAGENAQTAYGADVISRIEFANKGEDSRESLRQAVLTTINALLEKVCESAQISKADIFKVVIVGNTTMHHLFLGIDVANLAVSPFVSVCNTSLELNASEVELNINSHAKVIMFPNLASFVGGDTLGAIVGAENLLQSGRHLLIDIGTNCELYLQDGERMWACSTAAGPAFEGAGITYGMRAQPGAIERVKIENGEITVKTISDIEASGICGSGLIEAIEQMRQSGVITPQGMIVDVENAKDKDKLNFKLKSRIRKGMQGREFVLSYSQSGKNDIVLTQRDIGQLQLAKGAVCAGIRTLLEVAGLRMEDIDSVVLAGTFASHLNLSNIIDIGMIPCTNVVKLKTAGNAAHIGAVRALLNNDIFEMVRSKSNNIKHVELGGSTAFSRYFMESMYIEKL